MSFAAPSARLARAGLVILLLPAGGCLPPSTPASLGAPQGTARAAPAIFLSEQRPADGRVYAGSGRCTPCHAAVGDFWRGTAHARSMGTLRARGQENERSCLRCHTFGPDVFANAAGGEGREAVGCEACHGPSAEHAGRPSEVRTAYGINHGCTACMVSQVCRSCHTAARSPGFTPEDVFDTVKCPPDRAGSPAH